MAVQEADFIERSMGTGSTADCHASSNGATLEVASGIDGPVSSNEGFHEPLRQPSETVACLLLMNFTRHPSAFEEALFSSDLLREVCGFAGFIGFCVSFDKWVMYFEVLRQQMQS